MDASKSRLRNQILGLVFILLLLASAWLTTAIYSKMFSSDIPVRLHADRVGNQLKVNADVKVRGVMVGTVRSVTVTGDGVDIGLSMDKDKVKELPRNVSARLLPKTLFGQRYVSLVIPETPDPAHLDEGDLIQQDRGHIAIELEKALRDLLPVLQAVQPHKLASTLGAISQALEGRGKPMGETMVKLNQYVASLNPQLPQIQSDFTKLADTLAAYEKTGPEIVDALSELTTTAKTIADNKQNVADLFASATDASEQLKGFMSDNSKTLIGLAYASRPTLDLLARYAPEFPCLFSAINALKPNVEKALGAGTNQPGLHVTLMTKPSRGAYLPGRDAPRYNAGGGPRCYQAGNAVQSTAPSSAAPNSASESQFIAELLAPVYGVAPDDIPEWSGLLIGPLLRGAAVELK